MSESKKTKKRREKKASALRAELALVILFAVTAVILAVMLFFCYTNGFDTAFRLGLMLCIAYACAFGLLLTLSILKSIAAYRSSQLGVKDDHFPLGTFASIDQPTAVCDEMGFIVWMNDRFAKRSQKQILLSEDLNIKDLLDFSAGEFQENGVPIPPESDEPDAKTLRPEDLSTAAMLSKLSETAWGATAKGMRYFGGEYTVHAYPHISNKQNFFIIILTDTTRYNALNLRYQNSKMHIAYIAVDNLDELAQTDPEAYRDASNKAATIIKKWAVDNLAFIKEYERGKYVAMMPHKNLNEIVATKFPLLAMVSSVEAGKDNIAVTISAGFSSEEGCLEDKDRVAQYALEMALARGGNQAVIIVNGKDKPLYLGGKTTTSIKRSGAKHRAFADRLKKKILESDSVIIMGHRNPDFDAIGSCVGLARLVMALDKTSPADKKKRLNIITSEPTATLSECMQKLAGYEEYSSIFTRSSAALDLLASKTLLICSDVNNLDNFEAPELAKQFDRIFIIDHHRQSEKMPKNSETLIVPSASSASELVAEILGFAMPDGESLHPEEAELMYAGMLLDTKNFTRNTQVPTFDAAIYLRNSGADPNSAYALFKLDLEGFRTESAFSTDLEIYNENLIIAKETGSESSPEKRITAAKTADKLLNIKNIKASFVVTRMLNDVFISSRSDGSVNVQLIMEQLKGGGHYNAAATMIKDMSVDDAVERLKKVIDDYFYSDTEEVGNIDSKLRAKNKMKAKGRKALTR